MKKVLHAIECDCTECLVKTFTSEMNIQISIIKTIIEEMPARICEEMEKRDKIKMEKAIEEYKKHSKSNLQILQAQDSEVYYPL